MTTNEEVTRKDEAVRILGNKAYIGDQEVIGLFKVSNNSGDNIFKFDPDTQLLTAYDTDGNIVWSIDTSTGVMTLGSMGVLKVSDGSHNRILLGYQENGFGTGKDYGFKMSREGYAVETATDAQLIISSKFTIPRETNISFGRWNYTNVTSYEDLLDCACMIDFNDWPDSTCYLEITGKVGGGTASYRLYNQTDGEAIAGSEATTTSTTSTVFRSGAFTKPSGSKLLNLQYKVSDSAHYTDIYTCRVVMRYT